MVDDTDICATTDCILCCLSSWLHSHRHLPTSAFSNANGQCFVVRANKQCCMVHNSDCVGPTDSDVGCRDDVGHIDSYAWYMISDAWYIHSDPGRIESDVGHAICHHPTIAIRSLCTTASTLRVIHCNSTAVIHCTTAICDSNTTAVCVCTTTATCNCNTTAMYHFNFTTIAYWHSYTPLYYKCYMPLHYRHCRSLQYRSLLLGTNIVYALHHCWYAILLSHCLYTLYYCLYAPCDALYTLPYCLCTLHHSLSVCPNSLCICLASLFVCPSLLSTYTHQCCLYVMHFCHLGIHCVWFCVTIIEQAHKDWFESV